MDLASMSNEDLIAAFYGSNDEALDVLYRRLAPRLVGLLIHCGFSREDSEDTISKAFLRVLDTKHHKFGKARPFDRTRASFKTWLKRIAWRLLGNLLARRVPVRWNDVVPQGNDDESDESIDAAWAGREPSPEDLAIAREHRQKVHECIDALNSRERVAILLWIYWEDATHQSVADVLGQALATSWRGRNRAVENLRNCLEGKGVTFPDPPS